MAKYVEATTRALREMETPLATNADQLPKANDFLAELSRMTEEGTHKVMSLADAIGENPTQIKIGSMASRRFGLIKAIRVKSKTGSAQS